MIKIKIKKLIIQIQIYFLYKINRFNMLEWQSVNKENYQSKITNN